MKALVVKEFGGPLVLEDVPVPQPAADEALIRVKACAVDQFDLTIRDGKFAMAKVVPIILGHEIAGVVEAVGADVTSVSVGDRVTSTLYLTCGKCRYCLTGRETICADFKGYIGIHTPGAYAEYTTVPAVNLVKIPEFDLLPRGQRACQRNWHTFPRPDQTGATPTWRAHHYHRRRRRRRNPCCATGTYDGRFCHGRRHW